MPIDVIDPADHPFEDVRSLGLVINLVEQTFHVGVLYKLDGGPARIYHLAWHHRLLNETPTSKYHWIQSGLKPDTMRVIAAGINAFAKRASTKKIAYSPNYTDTDYFHPGTLRYLRTGPGEGLTCATFVLALHKAFQVKLLDTSTWPVSRESDQSWREHVIKQLRERPENDEHIEAHISAIETSSAALRYRPEEVAAGVGRSDQPVIFDNAVADGEAISKAIRRATALRSVA